MPCQRRWYIWYERGGIVHTYEFAIFDFAAEIQTPHLIAHLSVGPGELCSLTRSWFARGHEATELDSGRW